MNNNNLKETLKNWPLIVQKYQQADPKKAVIQLVNSFLPFLGLVVLMYFSLNWSYLFTLILAGIAAFFLVRIFIIQHDCGHQSFLKSRKWNDSIGFISSLFSTVPYRYWSRTHNAHHAHNGQIEHRGLGDTYFLTKDEYHNESKWGQIRYRIYRSPLVQFVIAPIVYFSITLRYPFTRLKGWTRIRWSFFINNLLVLTTYAALALVVGWQKLLLVHLPILFIFSLIAFWFFYIQHQHEDNYKEWQNNWDHLLASIKGSTYYKLPRFFRWLSGNIGLHHIHHLSSRIPNYHLQACADEHPILNKHARILTFRKSLKCIHHKLWDEESQRMISFREYNRNISSIEKP
ncbi:MAG: fatty acid desaturase [Saprospiraceae bacterium]|nr:fatty acid desaturase [Lewinella sp.]